MKVNKKGISLIVLVITIIVIIILAGAIILSLSANNPIESANKATFLSDVSNFKTELSLYETKQFSDNMGAYNPKLLQADEATATYNDVILENTTMTDLITSLRNKVKYAGQFKVVDGELVYQGSDISMQTWANELGIPVEVAGEPKVTIIPPADTVVGIGTDIVYTIKFSSNVALTTINLAGKVEVLDNAGVALTSQPVISIGTISGTSADSTRQVDITIPTIGLSYGSYKLKIKPESVTNTNDLYNTTDTISLIGFDITDNVPPENPTMLANPTLPTNGDVTVTITYSGDTETKEYSTDGTTWNNYTVLVVVSNNLTVYARGKDLAGNQNTGSAITINNIDKIIPTVAYGTNGGTGDPVSTTVTVSDLGGSLLNTSSLQYVWDSQNITTPVAGWTTFTNGANLTKTGDGTYYLWIKANDTAGNSVIEKSNAFTVGEVVEIVSTVQTVHKTFAGATTGFSYNNPVIPAGFVAVNTIDANWSNLAADYNKGLVIQDLYSNQFVWVPVNGTTVTYAKWCTTSLSYASTVDDTLPSGYNVANITTTYKGFYIARYEAMFDYNGGSIRVASKKSLNKTASSWTRDSAHTGYLFNFVSYTDSKTYSEDMDTSYGYDTSKVGTNLITGTQWDTALKWIQNSGKSVIDSRAWGNYTDSVSPSNVGNFMLQISGYSNYWKVKNIYDLAGNTFEWTNEIYSSYRVGRGGGYNYSGIDFPVAYRMGNSASSISHSMTFRPALYVL